jgi:hypothetical protein
MMNVRLEFDREYFKGRVKELTEKEQTRIRYSAMNACAITAQMLRAKVAAHMAKEYQMRKPAKGRAADGTSYYPHWIQNQLRFSTVPDVGKGKPGGHSVFTATVDINPTGDFQKRGLLLENLEQGTDRPAFVGPRIAWALNEAREGGSWSGKVQNKFFMSNIRLDKTGGGANPGANGRGQYRFFRIDQFIAYRDGKEDKDIKHVYELKDSMKMQPSLGFMATANSMDLAALLENNFWMLHKSKGNHIPGIDGNRVDGKAFEMACYRGNVAPLFQDDDEYPWFL